MGAPDRIAGTTGDLADFAITCSSNIPSGLSVVDTPAEVVGDPAVDSKPHTNGVSTDLPDAYFKPILGVVEPPGDPDPDSGVVTGRFTLADPNGDWFTCTIESDTAKGDVTFDPVTGRWTFTPTREARHRAVADNSTADDRKDVIKFTFSDWNGGTFVVPVTVSLVTMTNVRSYTVTAEYPVGTAPTGLAVSPHGDRVYVTNFDVNATVTVVDTTDGTTSIIPLSFSPGGVAVGPDGSHIYVADPVGHRVAIIDTADNTTTFVPVGAGPLQMALEETDLYVANNQDGTVTVIDTIGNTVARTINVGGYPYAVAAGGGNLYVTDYRFYGGQSAHIVSVIDAATGHVIRTVPVGYYPTGVAVSPDGTRAYVTNDEGSYTATHPGTTTVIDTVTGDVIETLPVGGISVAVGDDGGRVYVVSYGYNGEFTSKLTVVDAATGRITSVPINGMPSVMAADGDRIYVIDSWHSTVVQLTEGRTSITDTDAANEAPTLEITQVGEPDTRTGAVLFQATSSDPDDDTISYTIAQPFSGTVTDLGDGCFQYVPNTRAADGFVDHFAVTAIDGHGGITTKTVAATVVYAAGDRAGVPTMSDDAVLHDADGTRPSPLVTIEAAGPGDPETGAITFRVVIGDGGEDKLTFTATQPGHGLLTDRGEGVYTYVPDAEYFTSRPDGGCDKFAITVNDGHGGQIVKFAKYSWAPFAVTSIPIGDSPSTMVMSADGGHGYFTNHSQQDDYVLSDLDTTTNTVTNVPLTGRAQWVAASPDGDRTYVGGNRSVSVVDADTHTVSIIPVGDETTDMVVSPAGDALYILGAQSVSVIDTDTLAIATTVALGGAPTEIGISPDGAYVYVFAGDLNGATSAYDYALVVIDTSRREIAATIPLDSGQYGFAVGGDSRHVYVTTNPYDPDLGSNVGMLTVIDADTHTVAANIALPGAADEVAAAPDGNHAYLISHTYDDTTDRTLYFLSTLDANTNTLTSVAVPGYMYRFGFSADSSRLYASSLVDDPETANTNWSVSVIDLAANTFTTIPLPNGPDSLVVSPDGSRVYGIVADPGPVPGDDDQYTLQVISLKPGLPSIH
jgi:YVTN family beta-propeller protein